MLCIYYKLQLKHTAKTIPGAEYFTIYKPEKKKYLFHTW